LDEIIIYIQRSRFKIVSIRYFGAVSRLRIIMKPLKFDDVIEGRYYRQFKDRRMFLYIDN